MHVNQHTISTRRYARCIETTLAPILNQGTPEQVVPAQAGIQ